MARAQEQEEGGTIFGLHQLSPEFHPGLSQITAPLYELTSPRRRGTGEKNIPRLKNIPSEFKNIPSELKQVMTSVPVLGCPKADDPFILDTDASPFVEC